MQHPRPAAFPRRRARWPLLALAALSLAIVVPAPAPAQETGQVITSPSESAPIISTMMGEVPSTGARRPGPVDQAPLQAARLPGLAPVALAIERSGIDAQIEPLKVINGEMQDPTGPWTVAWYDNLASLGEGGNVVMAGHIDYWNVGPAVFYSIDELLEGDEITVIADDGQVFTYAVEWVRQYDADDVPLDEVVGSTGTESLTLITCGGTFDYTTAEYLNRTVVRATLVTS
ncbi:MAG: class F sortase [Chloroflexia bacterium]|nr:class F sortase [Chloroflexia bacterium]MDQ3412186.1 class F sortase [Chloroflexota bacterium]